LSQQDLDEACGELEKQQTLRLEDKKLYVGENYILQLASGLDVIKYSNIVWLYETRLSTNGVPSAKGLVAWTSDKVKHELAKFRIKSNTLRDLAEFKISDEQTEQMYNAVHEFLISRAPNAIHGYNRETQQQAKQQYGIKA